MALEYFLEKEGLKYFSQHLDQRFKNRLRYINELPLNPDTRVDFNDIAPVLTGAIYLLSGEEGEEVTINDVTYEPGDFIISMKRIIKQDDGTLVDENGNAADVEVKKLGSGGGKAINDVEELPSEGKDKYFYRVKYTDKIATYNLNDTQSAIYTITSDGLDNGGTIISWATIERSWNTVYSVWFVEAEGGAMTRFKPDNYNIHCCASANYTEKVGYNIYHYIDGNWYLVSDGRPKVDLNLGVENANKHLIVMEDGTVGLEEIAIPPTVTFESDIYEIDEGVNTDIELSATITPGTGNVNLITIYRGNFKIYEDTTLHSIGTTFDLTQTDTINTVTAYKIIVETDDKQQTIKEIFISSRMPTYNGYFGTLDTGISGIELNSKSYTTFVSMNYDSMIYKYPAALGELTEICVDGAKGYLSTFAKSIEVIGGVEYLVYSQTTTVALTNCQVDFI